MRTTSNTFLDLFQAEGASCHRLGFLLLTTLARKLAANLLSLVDRLNQAEDDKGDDKEVDAGANEGTEVNVRARDNQTRHRASTATSDDGNKGLMILAVRAVTMPVNAPPVMTATARSMTLPRLMNSLNSAKNFSVPVPSVVYRQKSDPY